MDDQKRITISYRKWQGMLSDARHARNTVELMYQYSQECRQMATDWEETATALDQALTRQREACLDWTEAALHFVEAYANLKGIPVWQARTEYSDLFNDMVLKEEHK